MPGVATAVSVVWSGALLAKHELQAAGAPLGTRDCGRGAAILIPAALAAHVLARIVPSGTWRRIHGNGARRRPRRSTVERDSIR